MLPKTVTLPPKLQRRKGKSPGPAPRPSKPAPKAYPEAASPRGRRSVGAVAIGHRLRILLGISQPLVNLAHVDFSYGSQDVLSHIHLPVAEGSILGLIGPNGGGKTTLLQLVLGFLQPTAGSITVAGMPPMTATRRGDITGYLPQNPAITRAFPLSVRQSIRLGLTGKTGLFGSIASADRVFADSLIDRLGLAAVAEHPIGELSGGQLQRALIARALAPRPRLLLLDEPTTGMDNPSQQSFIQTLMDLKSALGLTIILVSHDLRLVWRLCDRIACLNTRLHYHDVQHNLPESIAADLFQCDLEAMGAPRPAGHDCPACEPKGVRSL